MWSNTPVNRKHALGRICSSLMVPQSVLCTSMILTTSPSTSSATTTETTTTSPNPTLLPFTDNKSFNDAMDILTSQRIACDDIINVISDGNLNEAVFKIKQLNAQTKLGGKMVLESIQANTTLTYKNGKIVAAATAATTTDVAISTVKYLQCQDKFTTLLDLCGDCETQMEMTLKGKYGATAPAQMRLI